MMSPGKKPQALAGLDRRPREDDAVDVLGLQRLHRHRHGQPALAGARRADAERDDVLADGVDVALLPARLRPHRATSRRRSTSAVSTSDGRSSAFTMSIVRVTLAGSSRWPCCRRITSSSKRRPTRSASTGSPSMAISLPRTWISTPGKAPSTSRNSSSRWPSKPGHQVIPGHADLHLGRAHDLAKRTVGRWTSPAVRCRRARVCWADRISPPGLERWVADARSADAAAASTRALVATASRRVGDVRRRADRPGRTGIPGGDPRSGRTPAVLIAQSPPTSARCARAVDTTCSSPTQASDRCVPTRGVRVRAEIVRFRLISAWRKC